MKKTLLLSTLSALALTAASSASAENVFTIVQAGTGNTATGVQIGANVAEVYQEGDFNWTAFTQNGANYLAVSQTDSVANQAASHQNGSGNSTVIMQDGSFYNRARSGQDGEDNYTEIVQTGYNNTAQGYQQGVGNALIIHQHQPVDDIGNTALALQIGVGNYTSMLQIGSNYAEARANGVANSAEIIQDNFNAGFGTWDERNIVGLDVIGTNNYFGSIQYGPGNWIGGPGYGESGVGAFVQLGESNYANIFQYWDWQGVFGGQAGVANWLDVAQHGSFNFLQTWQEGVGNAAVVTQGSRDLNEEGSIGNVAALVQVGVGNYASIDQHGYGNQAYVAEHGVSNSVVLEQQQWTDSEGNTSAVEIGEDSVANYVNILSVGANLTYYAALPGSVGNSANILVANSGFAADANIIGVTQGGLSNWANIDVFDVDSNNNTVSVTQLGINNGTDVHVRGQFNETSVTQIGHDHYANVVNHGVGQTVNIFQSN